jgi:hypothetical protein
MAGISKRIRARSRMESVDAIYKADERTTVSAFYRVRGSPPTRLKSPASPTRLAYAHDNRAVTPSARPGCELHTVAGTRWMPP